MIRGGACISRVGDCVLAIANFCLGFHILGERQSTKSVSARRRTNTRDACATQTRRSSILLIENSGHNSIGLSVATPHDLA
jgi:hypothetical protein